MASFQAQGRGHPTVCNFLSFQCGTLTKKKEKKAISSLGKKASNVDIGWRHG